MEHVDGTTEFELEAPDGRRRRYRVARTEVRHARETEVLASTDDRLTLITCYPFDAVQVGGPLRFVVTAEPLDAWAAR